MRWLALALLLAQSEDAVQLDREHLSVYHPYTLMGVVEIQAVHADGTSARGKIACSGSWFKEDDGTKLVTAWNLPFETDSRGLIILNPGVGDFEEDPMTCTALDTHGHTGSVSFTVPTERVEIIVQ